MEINIEKANKFGISTHHDIYDNGEKRFRLRSNDNTSYIRTEGSNIGYWQKSHYHSQLYELYIVQKEWIKIIYIYKDEIYIEKLNYLDTFTINPRMPHNIYMPPHAITHTVKFGDSNISDWIEYPELDKHIKLSISLYIE